eukprot:UC4_evm1s89
MDREYAARLALRSPSKLSPASSSSSPSVASISPSTSFHSSFSSSTSTPSRQNSPFLSAHQNTSSDTNTTSPISRRSPLRRGVARQAIAAPNAESTRSVSELSSKRRAPVDSGSPVRPSTVTNSSSLSPFYSASISSSAQQQQQLTGNDNRGAQPSSPKRPYGRKVRSRHQDRLSSYSSVPNAVSANAQNIDTNTSKPHDTAEFPNPSTTTSSSLVLNPSPRKIDSTVNYSDRYIPSRQGSNWQTGVFKDAYQLNGPYSALSPQAFNASQSQSPSRRGVHLGNAFQNMAGQQQEANDQQQGGTSSQTPPQSHIVARDDPGKVTYSLLLRNELLGARVDNIKGYSSEDRAHAAAMLANSMSNGHSSFSEAPLNHDSMLGDGCLNQMMPPQPSSSYANGNVFRYKSGGQHSPMAKVAKAESPYSLSPVGINSQRLLLSPRKAPRKISKVPYKVLDAPSLQDDFYLNLVDWSSQNVLSVGLGSCVYLWSACTSKVTKLCDLEETDDDIVTSVEWMHRGSHLAVGTNKGYVQVWDATRCKCIRTLGGHSHRVGSLAWGSHTLASGSRDKSILLRDVRCQDDYRMKLSSHKQEVCGLKWSPDNQHLASGGNDNKLMIWGSESQTPITKFSEHRAAVKAIAWLVD